MRASGVRGVLIYCSDYRGSHSTAINADPGRMRFDCPTLSPGSFAKPAASAARMSARIFKRLEWLHENHKITPDIRSWADHVRVEGNAALREPEEFGEGDAKALRFFTEMFLRYVFELPGAVEEFRGKTAT